MQYDDIAYLRVRSASWRLLRSDNAGLVLAALGGVFVVDHHRSMAESDLIVRVDDILHEVNGTIDPPPFPRSARDYLSFWAAPEQGWLRKYYPDGAAEAHFDATSDLEKAYAWVLGLQSRTFVGTESRLHTLVDLLRQMVHGAEADPAARVALLQHRRAELDAEIARAEAGSAPALDGTALLDRFQHFTSTSRELLADFREVEENFRALDRSAREKIAGWDGSKGDLLDGLITDRQSISASDQGRSFQAFYEFLLSRSSQEELTELLERLIRLEQLQVDRSTRTVHYDWLDAAERTQQTVRQLSEQLRRFLDDRVWLENRRVMDLLRSIERSALRFRADAPTGPFIELDAVAPRPSLPMERPLYAPTSPVSFEPIEVADSRDTVDTTGLFDDTYVDAALLADHARYELRHRTQVGLSEVLVAHPPEFGLAAIVAYLALTEDDFEVVSDEDNEIEIPFVDSAARRRILRLPEVTFVRRAVSIGQHR